MEMKIEVTPELLAGLKTKAAETINHKSPLDGLLPKTPIEVIDITICNIILALIHRIEHLEAQAQWLATAQNYGIDHEDPTRCPEGKEPPQDCCSACAECWLKAAKEATSN